MNRPRCAGPHPEHSDVRCELVADHAGSHYHYGPTYVLSSWRDGSPTTAVAQTLTLAAEVAPEIPEIIAVELIAPEIQEIAPDHLPTAVPAPVGRATTPEAPSDAALPAARHSADDEDPPPVSVTSILANWGRTAS